VIDVEDYCNSHRVAGGWSASPPRAEEMEARQIEADDGNVRPPVCVHGDHPLLSMYIWGYQPIDARVSGDGERRRRRISAEASGRRTRIYSET
jgi:hypothetical protein